VNATGGFEPWLDERAGALRLAVTQHHPHREDDVEAALAEVEILGANH
jgi:hypothetical protein